VCGVVCCHAATDHGFGLQRSCPLFMEQTLAAWQQGMRRGEKITLTLGRAGATVGPGLRRSRRVAATRDDTTPRAIPVGKDRGMKEVLDNHEVWSAELSLRPELFPLKRHPQFTDQATQSPADPLSGILSSLAGGERDPLRPRVELTVGPVSHRRIRRSQKVLHNLQRPGFAVRTRSERYLRWALSDRWPFRALAWWYALAAGSIPLDRHEPAPSARTHDRETALQSAHDKLRRRLFEVRLRLLVRAPADQEERALAKLQELAGAWAPSRSPNWLPGT